MGEDYNDDYNSGTAFMDSHAALLLLSRIRVAVEEIITECPLKEIQFIILNTQRLVSFILTIRNAYDSIWGWELEIPGRQRVESFVANGG